VFFSFVYTFSSIFHLLASSFLSPWSHHNSVWFSSVVVVVIVVVIVVVDPGRLHKSAGLSDKVRSFYPHASAAAHTWTALWDGGVGWSGNLTSAHLDFPGVSYWLFIINITIIESTFCFSYAM